jgi:hypothetical protein
MYHCAYRGLRIHLCLKIGLRPLEYQVMHIYFIGGLVNPKLREVRLCQMYRPQPCMGGQLVPLVQHHNVLFSVLLDGKFFH